MEKIMTKTINEKKYQVILIFYGEFSNPKIGFLTKKLNLGPHIKCGSVTMSQATFTFRYNTFI